MKTFNTKEGLVCMNKELDEIFSILSNFSDNGMLDLIELVFPGKEALPDKSVCRVLDHSLATFRSLGSLCFTLRAQLENILGK